MATSSGLSAAGSGRVRGAAQCPVAARLLFDQLQARPQSRHGAAFRRVGAMSRTLARRLGLDAGQADSIGRAGELRDIGLALVPGDLLDRDENKLSIREREILHQHSAWGHDIIDMTGDPDLALAAEVALQHHERWDGSGYPAGRKGEEIGLAARIVAICAVYDSLRHPGPGSAPLDHHAALKVLRTGDQRTSATAFDPAVRKAFFLYSEDFRRIAGDGPRLAGTP